MIPRLLFYLFVLHIYFTHLSYIIQKQSSHIFLILRCPKCYTLSFSPLSHISANGSLFKFLKMHFTNKAFTKHISDPQIVIVPIYIAWLFYTSYKSNPLTYFWSPDVKNATLYPSLPSAIYLPMSVFCILADHKLLKMHLTSLGNIKNINHTCFANIKLTTHVL